MIFVFFSFPLPFHRFSFPFKFLLPLLPNLPSLLAFWGSAELLSPLQQKHRSLIWPVIIITIITISFADVFPALLFRTSFWSVSQSPFFLFSLSCFCLFSFSVCFSGLSGLSRTNNVRSEYLDYSGFGLLIPSSDIVGVRCCH